METGEAALERLLDQSTSIRYCGARRDAAWQETVSRSMTEMRQAGQFVPTLMLTARGHPDDVLKGFAAGADDYLTKPFELAILIARIRGLLRRREWLRASSSPVQPCPSARHTSRSAMADKSVNFDLLELCVGSSVSADPNGRQRTAVSDRARRESLSRARRCWKKCGACTKTPTPGRLITSLCVCGGISRTIPRSPGTCSRCAEWDTVLWQILEKKS